MTEPEPSNGDGRVVTLAARLDEDHYEALRTKAFHERRSMNEVISELPDMVLKAG